MLLLSLLLASCVDTVVADTAERPDGSRCEDALVWSAFYESCVNACPTGGAYTTDGLCVATLASLY